MRKKILFCACLIAMFACDQGYQVRYEAPQNISPLVITNGGGQNGTFTGNNTPDDPNQENTYLWEFTINESDTCTPDIGYFLAGPVPAAPVSIMCGPYSLEVTGDMLNPSINVVSGPQGDADLEGCLSVMDPDGTIHHDPVNSCGVITLTPPCSGTVISNVSGLVNSSTGFSGLMDSLFYVNQATPSYNSMLNDDFSRGHSHMNDSQILNQELQCGDTYELYVYNYPAELICTIDTPNPGTINSDQQVIIIDVTCEPKPKI